MKVALYRSEVSMVAAVPVRHGRVTLMRPILAHTEEISSGFACVCPPARDSVTAGRYPGDQEGRWPCIPIGLSNLEVP